LHASSGQLQEALASCEQARRILEKLEHEPSGAAEPLKRLVLVLNHLGMLSRKAGHPVDALANYERGLEIQQRLARREPSDPWVRSNLAVLHHNIGNLRIATHRPGAKESLERAVKIYESLVEDYHAIAEFRIYLARSLGNLAFQLPMENGRSQRIAAFRKIADLQRQVVRDHPDVVDFVLDLATTIFNLAEECLGGGHPQDTLSELKEGTTLLDALLSKSSDPTGQAWNLSSLICEKRAEALVVLGQEREAADAYQAALKSQRKALDQSPQSAEYRDRLFGLYLNLTKRQLLLGHADQAVASIEAMRPLWPRQPESLFGNACKLARGFPKVVSAQVESGQRSEVSVQTYAALIVAFVDRSVAAGFRDFTRLINEPAFAPLRSREDFQAVLFRLLDLTFPENPFR
jgi:tetratricopeptide (TPR) repeat protein